MNLANLFSAVAHKELVSVDLPKAGSNQHELNGVAALRQFFGTSETTRGIVDWLYFCDDREPLSDSGEFTFYDARAKSASRTGRTEWRFYYSGDFLSRASTGDLLVLVRTKTNRFFCLVFQKNSAWSRAARNLFSLPESSKRLDAISNQALNRAQLTFMRRQIIENLGLDIRIPWNANDIDLVIRNFGTDFPSTRRMSAFARTQVEVDFNDPDETLIRWLEREEELFRALEHTIVNNRLTKGFRDTDDFISFSLSVQNRRKSRMGLALQNHLSELFTVSKLKFTAQARTEPQSKPDFIFPGEREYHDDTFDETFLVMLGAKSTCKDRWRQILTEADRIKRKHLCTLEGGISVRQTTEMQRQSVTLVVPKNLHATYTETQLEQILSIKMFIDFVREKQ